MVRDTWPRTSRVFCARVEDGWPADVEVVEEVPVTLCRRRGVAIDLVLERPRENRSQFVFTTLPSGREGIFWQTRKVNTTARPGARIPGRRASGIVELVIVVDGSPAAMGLSAPIIGLDRNRGDDDPMTPCRLTLAPGCG